MVTVVVLGVLYGSVMSGFEGTDSPLAARLPALNDSTSFGNLSIDDAFSPTYGGNFGTSSDVLKMDAALQQQSQQQSQQSQPSRAAPVRLSTASFGSALQPRAAADNTGGDDDDYPDDLANASFSRSTCLGAR